MRQQRRPEQQIEPQRRTQKLRQVSRNRRHLRSNPQPDRHRPRKVLAAVLRQRQPSHNPQLRREVLDQNRHRVRPQQHPQQPIAEAASTLNIRSEVARIDIRNRRHKRRPKVAPHLVAAKAKRRRRNRARRRDGRGRRRCQGRALFLNARGLKIRHVAPRSARLNNIPLQI